MLKSKNQVDEVQESAISFIGSNVSESNGEVVFDSENTFSEPIDDDSMER